MVLVAAVEVLWWCQGGYPFDWAAQFVRALAVVALRFGEEWVVPAAPSMAEALELILFVCHSSPAAGFD